MTRRDVLILAAIAACLVGMAWTVKTLRDLPDRVRRIEQKAADLSRLRALERELRVEQGALAALEALPDKTPVSPAELFALAVQNVRVDTRPGDSVPVGHGWTRRETVMSIDALPLGDLARFLEGAEAARPPWRLRRIALAAANREGVAKATLSLEALEKTP